MAVGDVVLPSVIQGPAFITVNGTVLYVQKDISLDDQAESWNPDSSHGPLGERHKSRKAVLSFTPVGMITAGLLDFFYGAHKDPTKIGKSIVGVAPAVSITSITEAKTYNWVRGGPTKPPGLKLSPTATAFTGMDVTCIGGAAVQPLGAAFLKAADGAAAAETSFDHTKILSDIYSAALGAQGAPYNGMGGMDGFELGFTYQVQEVPAADVGIADIILAGLGMTVSFAPSNLTEAQADTLLKIQGAGAVLPGQAYAKAGENLVITGTQTGWVFTVNKVGAKRSQRVYAIGQHRFKTIEFVNERTWAVGVPDPLFAYTAPA